MTPMYDFRHHSPSLTTSSPAISCSATADDTASPGKHGMGTGLAVCAAIVKAHGGEIKAESRPGEGTTIRFWLETESTDESTDLEENI